MEIDMYEVVTVKNGPSAPTADNAVKVVNATAEAPPRTHAASRQRNRPPRNGKKASKAPVGLSRAARALATPTAISKRKRWVGCSHAYAESSATASAGTSIT